jgi:hypothetical protein
MPQPSPNSVFSRDLILLSSESMIQTLLYPAYFMANFASVFVGATPTLTGIRALMDVF